MARNSGIYKTVNGQRVELKASEVKSYIMKVNGWTSEQYRKQYDIFKNKLRAFEGFERASGKNITAQSPAQVLYFEARSKQRQGAEYSPSLKMQRIRSFTSISSGKALQKALKDEKYITRRSVLYENTTYRQFSGLINKNAKAKEIWDSIKDPVKREQALTAYANKLHAKIDEQGRIAEAEAIPFGETLGSLDEVDFDYSNYLD